MAAALTLGSSKSAFAGTLDGLADGDFARSVSKDTTHATKVHLQPPMAAFLLRRSRGDEVGPFPSSDLAPLRHSASCGRQVPGRQNRSVVPWAAVQERSQAPQQNGSLFSRILPEIGRQVIRRWDREPSEEEKPLLGKLIDGGMVYRERFMIRCYEVGVNRTASLETIANLFQEIGCNHAQSVGFSNDGFATTPAMRKKRLIWVTTRMHIEMDSYPIWGEIVEIDTWFQGEGKIGARRDWVIRIAKTGETIGRGTSTWVTMNQDTRRLSKIPDDVRAEYMSHCPTPPRFAVANEQKEKIPKLETAESVTSNLMPRRNDLDMNQHVNNVTYIGWMLESVPYSVLGIAELAKITLEYRRECSQLDVVESMTSSKHPARTARALAAGGIPLLVGSGGDGNGAAAGGGEPAEEDGVAEEEGNAAPGTLEFYHMLRTQEGSLEINRGHTVWRLRTQCSLVGH